MAEAGPSRTRSRRLASKQASDSIPWAQLSNVQDLDQELGFPGIHGVGNNDDDDDEEEEDDDEEEEELPYEDSDSQDEFQDPDVAAAQRMLAAKRKRASAAKGAKAVQRRNQDESDSDEEDDDDDEDEDDDENEDEDDEDGYLNQIEPALLGSASTARAPRPDGEVEFESESFNRLVSSLQDTSRQTGALRRVWDTSIEEENEQFENELRASAGFKKRKNTRRVSREQNLSMEVRSLLSDANLLFVDRHLQEAIPKLEEVIRIEPTVISAWRTLGLIYEELGEEEKSIQCRIVGAHLQPGANLEWKGLAERSMAMGLYRQAVYCYQQAIKIDKTDIQAIWERAILLRDLGDVKPAINGMLDILKLQPHDPSVIRELIPMLVVSTKDYDRGIQILQDWRQYNVDLFPDPTIFTGDPDSPQNTFGVSELVTLGDLLLLVRRPADAIALLRTTARWLDGRSQETFWDAVSDDREFDEDRDDQVARSREPGGYGRMVEMAPPHQLDPEIRLRLGKARMMVRDEIEARRHFDRLTDLDPAEYPTIFGEVGDCFYENKMWAEALDVFTDLATNEWIDDVSLYAKMAACNHALGELKEAARLYEPVVEASPDNLEWRMGLAEVYEELGDKDRSLEVLRGVVRLLQAQKQGVGTSGAAIAGVEPAAPDEAMEIEQEGDAQMSFFDEFSAPSKDRPAGRRARMNYNREQRLKIEKQREQDTMLCWRRLELLQSHVFVDGFWRSDVPLTRSREMPGSGIYGSHEAPEAREARYRHTAQWLEEATSLVESFRSTPKLHPTKRKRGARHLSSRPSGLAGSGRRNISSQAQSLLQRLQDQMMEDDLEAEHAEIPGMDGSIHKQLDQEKFRGISIDSWIDLFAKYAFVLTKGEEDQDLVNEVMQSLFSSNVVWGNFRRMLTVQLSWLSCAMYARDFEAMFSCLRWLSQEHQFHGAPLRLMASVINATGFHSLGRMASNKDAKFYQRRMRYTEAVVNGLPCNYSSSKHRYIVPTGLFNATKTQAAAKPGRLADKTLNGGGGENDGASSADEENEDEEDDEEEDEEEAEEDATGPKTNGSAQPDEATRVRLAKPTKPSPIAEMLYAYMMLCSGGYQASAAFFARAFAVQQSDPLLCLCAAVAFVGRSTNRQTDNRHHMVLQALSFLGLYKEHRLADTGEAMCQETEYNTGRLLHHIGLFHLAVPHYERVLCMARQGIKVGFDMHREAAYNLALIYTLSGSPQLARGLYETHLRVE